ncbi:MAG: CBO0543 family protein [Clostridia bacterium]
MVICFVIAALLWGDRRNWRSYYSTILFFIAGDLIYNFLLHDYPLWRNQSQYVSYKIIALTWDSLIFTSTILIYFKDYPSSTIQRIKRVLIWVAIYSTIELILITSGYFSHHNGWNIYSSVAANLIMFPTLKIHFHKPGLAWIIYSASALFIIWFFKVPLNIFIH